VLVEDAERAATIPAAEAAEMLRLSRDELDWLTAVGLPCAGVGESRRYDYRDLYNVGLYSGTGRSRPEQALKVMMRFASLPAADLLSRRRWLIRMSATCLVCRGSEWSAGSWHVRQPDLEPAGGQTISWQVHVPAGGAAAEAVPDLLVEGVVETIGSRRQIRSPAIRAVVDEFLARGLRWHLLTSEQRRDIELAHRSGVTDCVIASRHLADQLTAMGIQASTRRGWMSGFVNSPHTWLEVVDEDGVLKMVDAVLPGMAEMLSPGSESYRRLALGSFINRVIRADCPGDQPLVVHRHGDEMVDVDLLTEVRPVRSSGQG
jgi:hypothetical protein